MATKDWEIKFESGGQVLWRNKKNNHHIQIADDYGEGWFFSELWNQK
ncbi:MAG: hypothetical protein KKF56_05120 [Nanoarchaeota archaeon]|nr:hypothetical protein [Nanoarchaeota archaeon]